MADFGDPIDHQLVWAELNRCASRAEAIRTFVANSGIVDCAAVQEELNTLISDWATAKSVWIANCCDCDKHTYFPYVENEFITSSDNAQSNITARCG